jgi:hypothetical protein
MMLRRPAGGRAAAELAREAGLCEAARAADPLSCTEACRAASARQGFSRVLAPRVRPTGGGRGGGCAWRTSPPRSTHRWWPEGPKIGSQGPSNISLHPWSAHGLVTTGDMTDCLALTADRSCYYAIPAWSPPLPSARPHDHTWGHTISRLRHGSRPRTAAAARRTGLSGRNL